VRELASGEHHLNLTDLAVDARAPSDLAHVHPVRWGMDLPFMVLRSHRRIEQMPSRQRSDTEALLDTVLVCRVASRSHLGTPCGARRACLRIPAQR